MYAGCTSSQVLMSEHQEIKSGGDVRTLSLCSSSCDACFSLSTSSADPLDERLVCAAKPFVALECWLSVSLCPLEDECRRSLPALAERLRADGILCGTKVL